MPRFGHNHFFKNNYLFQQWTDAGGILSYLDFAKSYIARCEERHGLAAVEEILDAAHALMDQGVFRYRRPPKLSSEKRARAGCASASSMRSDPSTISGAPCRRRKAKATPTRPRSDGPASAEVLKLPEENLLYFLEKNSLVLEPWQREILRIVRIVAQYFYPQRQTQVMNEGCATFVHYTRHEHAVRPRPDQRRRHAGDPAQAIPTWSSSRPSTTRAIWHQSLCAWALR